MLKNILVREYVFIVDVFGLMRGFLLNIFKKFLRDLIVGLCFIDCFNVFLFFGNFGWLVEELIEVIEVNVEKVINVIDK